MKIFKIKEFNKWAKKVRLTEKALIDAANEIAEGLVDVNLGGHLYKKRIVSQSSGKSSGFRTLLAYKRNEKYSLFMDLEKMNAQTSVIKKK